MILNETSLLSKAKSALESIPNWSLPSTQFIKQISNGPSNHSWLIESNGMQAVLRIDKQFAHEHLLDRQNEATIQTICANNGFSPQLIYSDPEQGIFLSQFISGRTWTSNDLQNKKQLSILAKRLLLFHLSLIHI